MNNENSRRMRLRPVAYFIATQLAMTGIITTTAHARDYFNPELLELGAPGQKPVDLSAFENKGGQLPGTYRVDIYLNNNQMETRNVEFRMVKSADGQETLQPCLAVNDLETWGVLVKKFPLLGKAGSDCANISAVPQANTEFRFDKQQLLLTFPQSAVTNSARGWVDPKQWDEGITALLLNYSASGSSNYAKSGQGYDGNNQYVNLRPGLNMGSWRLRNYTTWNRSSTGGPGGETDSHWDTVYTYLQRDIIPLKAQLTAGDSSTGADVFDSISYRGIELASDDEMLPDSLRGYAPVVRGIARTNAQVTIRQNGYIIYQTSVSPGAFEINDMYPTGGSGDLYVTIKESDGSEQQMVVPFASLPVLQREGRFKFSLMSGVYRSYDNSVDEAPLSEGTARYGLPAGFTAYGGGQFASPYQSVALGLGKNMGDIGALSVDVTQAWSTMKDQPKESGQSWRVRYSKNIVDTGTNFTIAGYRYATAGYWGMQEVLDTYTSGNSYPLIERRRNRAELSVSQDLWEDAGNMGLTAVREDYWNTDRRMESYGVSYNNSWNSISYNLSYTYNRNSTANYGSEDGGRIYDNDQLFSMSISVPMSLLLGQSRNEYVNYMVNTSKKGNTNHSVSVGGTTLEQNNLSWSVQEGYGTKGQGNSGSANADWRSTYGELTAGYGYDQYSERMNYGVQGGVLVHENGVTLGQPMSETVALVAAPGAKGVNVSSQTGVRTDFRGYALVPYVSPYRKNDITLDTQSFGDDTEVAITNQTVIPTRGAVVRANYKASVGYRALMSLKLANGENVPFGAMATVKDSKDSPGYIVGDNGQVYLTGLDAQGSLLIKWGNGSNEQCQASYSIPDSHAAVTILTELCR